MVVMTNYACMFKYVYNTKLKLAFKTVDYLFLQFFFWMRKQPSPVTNSICLSLIVKPFHFLSLIVRFGFSTQSSSSDIYSTSLLSYPISSSFHSLTFNAEFNRASPVKCSCKETTSSISPKQFKCASTVFMQITSWQILFMSVLSSYEIEKYLQFIICFWLHYVH